MNSLIKKLWRIPFKTKIGLVLALLLLAVTVILFSYQKYRADTDTRMNISGRVFNGSDEGNQPLEGVKVTVSSQGLTDSEAISESIEVISDNLGSFNITIPDETLYDLITFEKEGYWDIEGTFTLLSQTSDPKEVTLVLPMKAGFGKESVHLQTIMPFWNLISTPLVPEDPNPASFFAYYDIASDPTTGQSLNTITKKTIETDAVLTRYDNDIQSVYTYDAWSPEQFGQIQPGQGYWLQFTGQTPQTVVMYGSKTDNPYPDGTLAINKAGWALVGLPTSNNIKLKDIFVSINDNSKTLLQAVNDGEIEQITRWDGEKQSLKNFDEWVDPDESAVIGSGYWVKIKQENTKLTTYNFAINPDTPLEISNIEKVYKPDNVIEINFSTNRPSYSKLVWGTGDVLDQEIYLNESMQIKHKYILTIPDGVEVIKFKIMASKIKSLPPPGDEDSQNGDDSSDSNYDYTQVETAQTLKIIIYQYLKRNSVNLVIDIDYIDFSSPFAEKYRICWGETVQYTQCVESDFSSFSIEIEPEKIYHYIAYIYFEDGSIYQSDDRIVQFLGIQNIRVEPGYNTATISWDTSFENSGGMVYYSTDPSLSKEVAESGDNFWYDHEEVLRDLEEDTTYYYQIRAVYDDGAVELSKIGQFHTLVDPVLKCEITSNIEDGQWVPDEYKLKAKCTTKTNNYGAMFLALHDDEWSDDWNTLMIKLRDEQGEVIKEDFDQKMNEFEYTFDVLDETRYTFFFAISPDEVPILSGDEANFKDIEGHNSIIPIETPKLEIGNVNIQQSPLSVEWQTNFSSNGKIIFSREGDEKIIEYSSDDFSDYHKVLLNKNDFEPDTEYSLKIISWGKSGIEKMHWAGSFISPSLISNIGVTAYIDSARIVWDTTGVATYGIVEYGYGQQNTGSEYKESHTLMLTDLIPNTVYTFTIEAISESGKHYFSEPMQFKTQPRLIVRYSAVTSNDTVTISWETSVTTNCTVQYSGPLSFSENVGPGTVYTRTYYNMQSGKYDYSIKATNTAGETQTVEGYFIFYNGIMEISQVSSNAETGTIVAAYRLYGIDNIDYLHIEGSAKNHLLDYLRPPEVCPYFLDLSGNLSHEVYFSLPCSNASYSVKGYGKSGALYYAITSGSFLLGNPGLDYADISQFTARLSFKRPVNYSPYSAGTEGAFTIMNKTYCYDGGNSIPPNYCDTSVYDLASNYYPLKQTPVGPSKEYSFELYKGYEPAELNAAPLENTYYRTVIGRIHDSIDLVRELCYTFPNANFISAGCPEYNVPIAEQVFKYE